MPTRARLLFAIAVLAATSSCLSPVTLDLPAPGDHRALVLVTDPEGAARGFVLRAEAGQWVGPDGRAATIALRTDHAPLALAYLLTPEALQLPVGALSFLREEAEEATRALVPPAEARVGTFASGATTWTTTEVDPGLLERLRIPRFDFSACAQAGGCLAAPDNEYCSLPCPNGTPAAVPGAPVFPPVDGWVALPGLSRPDGSWIVAPREPPRYDCPDGEMITLTEAACRPVSLCPAAGQWPEGLPAGTVYVRAGANGSGQPEAPMGDLVGAVLAAPVGGVVVFEGTFDFAALLEDAGVKLPQVGLRGVCPERAVLQSSADTHFTRSLWAEDLSLALGGNLTFAGPSQRRLRRVEVRGGSVGVEGGELLVGASSFRPTTSAFGVAADGHLSLSASYVRGPYGVHAFAGGAVTFADVIIEGFGVDPGHGISCEACGPIDVRRTVIRDFNGAGIIATRSPSLAVTDAQFLETETYGIRFEPCEEIDGQIVCVDGGLSGGHVATASIARVRIRARHTAIQIVDADLHVTRAVLQAGWAGISVQARPVVASTVHLEELTMMDVGRIALELLSTPGAEHAARIRDVLVLRGDVVNAVKPTVLTNFFDLDLRRMHVDGGQVTGVELSCGGGHVEDLVVANVGGDGLRISPSAPLALARIHVENARLSGVRMYAEEPAAVLGADACAIYAFQPAPEVTLTDVRVDGDAHGERGLVFCGGAPTTVTRAHVESKRVAAHVQSSLLSFSEGSLQGTRNGLSLAPDAAPGRWLSRVKIDGDQGAVIRREARDICP